MNLPKEFTVIWRDKKDNTKQFETNDKNTAFNKSIRVEGTVYIDTRYKAKLRLYWYLWRKKEYNE